MSEFMNPEEVEMAKLSVDRSTLTPSQLEMVETADAAMRDVEQIFEGPINDQNVYFVLGLLDVMGLTDTIANREVMRENLNSLKPGDYIVANRLAYFKTADGKLQEAQAYVHRLEKATIAAMNFNKEQLIKLRYDLYATESALDTFQQAQTRRHKRTLAKRRKTLKQKSKASYGQKRNSK